jgi:hypothetical protein
MSVTVNAWIGASAGAAAVDILSTSVPLDAAW